MANFDVAIGIDFATFNELVFGDYIACAFTITPLQVVSGSTAFTFNPLADGTPTLGANPNWQPVLNASLNVAGPSGTSTVWIVFSFEIDVTPNNTLTLRVGTCSLDTSDPQVTAAAQQVGLAGQLCDYLNGLLAPISIPAMSFAGMNFLQTCEVGPPPSEDTYLMLYGGLSPVVLPSGGTAWPTGGVFAALDAAALNVLAASVFPITYSGSWSDDPFSASYSGTVTSADLSPDTGNQISASSISVSGSAGFTFHNHIPHLDDPTASGSLSGSFDASLSITTEGLDPTVYLTINNVNNIQIGGLPSFSGSEWFAALPIGDVVGAIQGTIASKINGASFDLYTFPRDITFSIAGTSFNVGVSTPTVTTIAGPGGSPLLTIAETL
jgi:hypothetical protein